MAPADEQQTSSVDLIPHTLAPPPGLIECEVVADIGCGIRPMGWYVPKRRILVEPYDGYRYILKKNILDSWSIVGATAKEYLSTCKPVEAIYLLDVIEHMHKGMGWEVIALALEKATTQIVIYTPKGFMEQDGGTDVDPWGLQGMHWQKHRSGWLPGEFPGWAIKFEGRGFFAVWTK